MIDLCRLTYDCYNYPAPVAGIYLRGQGVCGPSTRAYLIHSVRLVKSKVHPSRWALTCERLRAADIPGGATVYPIHWNSRARKQRTKYRSIP